MNTNRLGVAFDNQTQDLSGYRRAVFADNAPPVLEGLSSYQSAYNDIASRKLLGAPMAVFFGFGLLWIGWKVVGEHPKAFDLDPAHLHMGGYNFVAVGINAVLFIAVLKLFTNKYKAGPVSQFANFI